MAFVSACQEPYLNEALDASEKIPVLSSRLSNLDALNTFELYYAMPYTETKKEYVPTDLVVISDGEGNQYQLTETAKGQYSFPLEFTPHTNTIYTLEVHLPNGEILKSEDQELKDTVAVEIIFFEYNTLSTVEKNADGEFFTLDRQGIILQARLNQPQHDLWYRARADYYVHSQTRNRRSREYVVSEGDYNYIYEIRYDTVYDVYEGFTNTEFPKIGNLSADINYSPSERTVIPMFLPADPDCYNFSLYTDYEFIEWVIPVDIYQCDKNIYQYYEEAGEQLQASGQIFDPIPQQLTGNVFNVGDESSPVLGLFDVSSVNRQYYSVYKYESLGYRMYRGRRLKDTVISAGWYPKWYQVDTFLIDSVLTY